MHEKQNVGLSFPRKRESMPCGSPLARGRHGITFGLEAVEQYNHTIIPTGDNPNNPNPPTTASPISKRSKEDVLLYSIPEKT